MAKSGKSLEQLVWAIQDAVKDSPNISVHTNVLLKDVSGINREIDVLVENRNISPTFRVAFECKDYNKKVDVQIVDAVVGKFMDIPDIHDRVIVSSLGYTKSAEIKAASHNVQLFTLSKIPLDKILLPSTPILSDTMKTVPIDVSFILVDASVPQESTLIHISETIEDVNKYMKLFYANPPRYDEIKLMELGERFAQNDLDPIQDDLVMEVTPPLMARLRDGTSSYIQAIVYHVEISINQKVGKLVEQRIMNKEKPDIVAAEYAIDDKCSMVTVRVNDKMSIYLKTEDMSMIPPKKNN